MGAYTPSAKVWYATGTDAGKLDTITSTIASSIEDGLGARMTQQELKVGLKATPSVAQQLNGTPSTITFQVGTGWGQFLYGLDFNGGVATVKTAGLYIVSAAIGLPPYSYDSSRSVACWVYHNADAVGYYESSMSSTHTVSTGVTVAMDCVAGDTIQVKGSTGGGTVTGIAINTAPYCTNFNIALVQANGL